MSKTEKNPLDYQDPGAMSAELLNVPGFINELKDHTLGVSPRPNPPLAFAGALAMLAHLTGRSYVNERGNHTNLYLAALAPTGMGKDEPRVTNKRLADAVGILPSVPECIASGEALEDAVALSPSLLLQTDEADALLTTMRGEDSRAARLNEMVLRFFSDAKSGHAMRLKANQVRPQVIPLPHLTLFATGIPKFVYGSLTAKALENGLLGRCLFVESDEFCPLGDPRHAELPPRVVAAAQAMAAREKRFVETMVLEPVIVTETPEAKRKIADLRHRADEISRDLYEHDLKAGAALYCRLYEKAMKLATLWAVSENPENPQMSEQAVAWGEAFAKHTTDKMLYEAQFNLAEGKFESLKQRFLSILARHDGCRSRQALLTSLPVDITYFQRLVATLKASDLIDTEYLNDGKVGYILK